VPDAPTTTSVAKQATARNAINLSKINLIGVFGTASNRYAMVRQPNGRAVKVQVGDRVDGGRVQAITDRELRYVKNGTAYTLEMPKG
jgi:type IV pilus biogenesis protein PilP